MNEFITKKDNLLTKDECDEIIDWSFSNRPMEKRTNTEGYTCVTFFEKDLVELPQLYSLQKAIVQLKNLYIKEYPELNKYVNPWGFDYVRIKWWKPGDYYSAWHSEHSPNAPSTLSRVVSFLIYLSNNDAYTHFKRHDSVKSEIGCGIMFPAYYTHTHKGSICEKGLDRFIASGYFSFLSPNGNS
tara:strand:- start:43 stop:597 length:555 start_codon:yes stop_codon:yes gene_type:complete